MSPLSVSAFAGANISLDKHGGIGEQHRFQSASYSSAGLHGLVRSGLVSPPMFVLLASISYCDECSALKMSHCCYY